MAQPAKEKVAIYMTDKSGIDIGGYLSDYLLDAIVKNGEYSAIVRTDAFLKELKKEISYQQSGNVDEAQLSRLGKQFGVKYVMWSTVGKMQDQYYVSAKLIDVESTEAIKTSKPERFAGGDWDGMEQSCETTVESLFNLQGYSKNATIRGGKSTPVEGIEINGLVWAEKNVGAFSKEDYGSYLTYEEAKFVCPSGWRLPTKEELDALVSKGSTWTTMNGKNGRKFGSSDNFIFMPAAGYRRYGDGSLDGVGTYGYGWSSTPNGSEGAYLLGFDSSNASTGNSNRKYGQSVRCVAE
ncbi:hypothetical protein FACS1894178_7570 [Bacteroidia bacterium]|nr:hypothetical protein FACS1894178_7570 [Bacteroidia bacterium]